MSLKKICLKIVYFFFKKIPLKWPELLSIISYYFYYFLKLKKRTISTVAIEDYTVEDRSHTSRVNRGT